jgi:AAA+ ATPase superfamily predicted ATPase
MQISIMLNSIMQFIDRLEELRRLDSVALAPRGGLAVVYGRRRIGKTRLLLEWCAKHDGLYTVADQSATDIQRRYFAVAVATRIPGFGDVEYRDWPGLLSRLAQEAARAHWRGPIVFDELPYLVLSTAEMPSILQRWIDHDAAASGLIVAVAGSSQRMMQGLVLSGDAPLFGRAREILDLSPIEPSHLREVFRIRHGAELVPLYAAWGGVPRYWELASERSTPVEEQIEHLALDPLGVLHREPDRLLLEEVPSALEVRPVLDAIGAGAHRVSEIAGRIGRPATSLSRPLERLVGMGLVRREVPFGESEKKARRSLYRIDDPFFRLWFRVVAPHRALLAAGDRASRRRLLARYWPGLVAEAWEQLCRSRVPHLSDASGLGRMGPWQPAARWWSGELPEWDMISESADGRRLLLGEVKWSAHPLRRSSLERFLRELVSRRPPELPARFAEHRVIRALFVPQASEEAKIPDAAVVVTADDLLDE